MEAYPLYTELHVPVDCGRWVKVPVMVIQQQVMCKKNSLISLSLCADGLKLKIRKTSCTGAVYRSVYIQGKQPYFGRGVPPDSCCTPCLQAPISTQWRVLAGSKCGQIHQ